jgi:pimeloyl-ACP methyl ester carboxylesterase
MTTKANDASSEPRLEKVQCLGARGLHRMAYWEWGDPDNDRVLVCAHGVSRQGRDFDVLARAMRGEFRVVCPDVVGRGESDRLADPTGYALPGYVADMVTLLARVNAKSVSWVGTSMGGLIGIGLAALPGSPVGRLVLNDIGPTIDGRGARAHRRLHRPAAHLGERGRGRRLPVDDLAGLRPALARGVAGVDPADAAEGGRAPSPPLRPGDRGADARLHHRDGGGGAGGDLGRVRRHPLSDAAAARRRFRPALARSPPRR